MSEVSQRIREADAVFAPVADFYFRSRYAERRFAPGVADFTFGNPQEMPLPGFVTRAPRRGDATGQELVRLQDQRGRAPRLPRRARRPRARPRLRARGFRPHRRRLRRHRARLPPGARRGRRGDHLRAGLVLLRADAPCRQCRAAAGAARRAALRSRPCGDRGGDRAADADGDRQHPAQPHRPHLRPGEPRGPRRSSRPRLGADRPPHLPPLRRALSPAPLRSPGFRQPRGGLSVDACQLQLRQDPAHPRPAARLPRGLAADAPG